jgi:hypothetical protein
MFSLVCPICVTNAAERGDKFNFEELDVAVDELADNMRDKLELLHDNQKSVQVLMDTIRESQENIRQNSMDTHDIIRKQAEDLRDLVDEREQVLIDEVLDRESVKIQALTDQQSSVFNEVSDLKRLHNAMYGAVGQLKPQTTADQIKFLQLWAGPSKHELEQEIDQVTDEFLIGQPSVSEQLEKSLPIWDSGLPLANTALPLLDFDENPESELKPQETPPLLLHAVSTVVQDAMNKTQAMRDHIVRLKGGLGGKKSAMEKEAAKVQEAEPSYKASAHALALTRKKLKRTEQAAAQIESSMADDNAADEEFNEQIRELEAAQKKLTELKLAQKEKKSKDKVKASKKAARKIMRKDSADADEV